jgi:hypothetical protein
MRSNNRSGLLGAVVTNRLDLGGQEANLCQEEVDLFVVQESKLLKFNNVYAPLA